MKPTLEELKKVCDCVKEMKEDEYNLIFDKFLRFLSSITCWDIDGSNILKSLRTEEITNFKCGECLEFRPYYKNIDISTIKVDMITYNPKEKNNAVVALKDVSYIASKNKLLIDIPECCECTCNCCELKVIRIEYQAGYDLTSPEWLDMICHYLTAYIAMANQCFSVEDCCKQNQPVLAGRLKSKKVGEISYSWDTDKFTEEYLLHKLINNYYRRILAKYALCGREKDYTPNMWFGKRKDKK